MSRWKADRAALDARMVLKSARQADPIRVLDVHDARAGIGPKNPRTTGGARNHRADPGLQHARLVDQSFRRRQERGHGQEPFRKTTLLQELADNGHRIRGARYAGREFLGRNQSRQRRGSSASPTAAVTPGLKMWTWGFSSFTNGTDARRTRTNSVPTSNCGRVYRTSFSTALSFPR